MTWWNEMVAWADASPTLSGAVGGLIVLAIGAIATFVISRIPKLRRPVFGWIARTARRVPIRVTTPRRRAAALAAEYERGGRERSGPSFAAGVEEGEVTASARLVLEHEAALEELRSKHKSEESKAFSQGMFIRQMEIDRERERPFIRPRWHVSERMHGRRLEAHLQDFASGSSVRDVRVEVDPFFYSIKDTAQWSEWPKDDGGWFFGHSTLAGNDHGVTFSVHWTSETGTSFVDQVPLEGVGPAYRRPSDPTDDGTIPFLV